METQAHIRKRWLRQGEKVKAVGEPELVMLEYELLATWW